MENNTLNHWGIKGMRWGVRRFQNKDGSLTPAGKKRREQQDGDDSEKAKTSAPKKKSISDMTDEELNKAIARARLEDQYKALRPEQEPAIKKFVSTTLNSVVAPAAISAGRDFLEKAMKKVGADILKDVEPEDPDGISALTKVRDKLKLKSEINKYKNSLEDDDVNWENRKKKLEYEKEKAKAAKDKEDSAEKEAKTGKKDTAKKEEVDRDSFDTSDDSSSESTNRAQKPTEQWWKPKDTKSGKSYADDVIDMSTSTDLVVSSSARSRAEDFINDLFEEFD